MSSTGARPTYPHPDRRHRAAGQRRAPTARAAAPRQRGAGLRSWDLLGVYPDVAVSEVSCTLRRNEMLVLYTDGVTEARGTDGFYGPDRLEKVLRAANG